MSKLFDVPKTDPGILYRYRDAVGVSELLIVVIAELDLFTELERQPGTVAELAGRLGVAERPLDVAVTLSAALGLVERGPVVRCTALAREHLVRGTDSCLAPYYASLKRRPQVAEMLEVVRSGRPASWTGPQSAQPWVDAMQSESFAAEFTAAMDCRGVVLAPALASRLSLEASRRLLDIAGGSGVYACALADATPGLQASVLERAPMDEVARRAISRRGFASRVSVVAGDMFTDPYPEGHDVHLLYNVLHDWDEPAVRRLLDKSAEALPVGGRLVVFDAHLDADKSGPLEVAEYSVFLMHATEGRCYSVAELARWLHEAGFGEPVHTPVAAHRSALVATKQASAARSAHL
jgi:hypothetical protein